MFRSTKNVKVVDKTVDTWAAEKVQCPYCHTAVYDGEEGKMEACPHLILTASNIDSENILIYDKDIQVVDTDNVEDKVRKAMRMIATPAELHVFREDDYLTYYLFRK